MKLPLDVHLMISRPDHYLPRFLEAGAHSVTVHLEAKHEVAATLKNLRQAGCGAGLAINPATPLSAARAHLPNIDLLLTMEKVAEAARLREENGWSYHIEVDGGINHDTSHVAREAGANVTVAGTSVFRAGDAAEAIRRLR